MNDAYLALPLRTAIGKHRGALASVRPDDLAADLVREALKRMPMLASCIDEVIFGATNQAGEDNRNLGRMVALLSGLPLSVPGVTVNRLCGSGMEAVADAARRVQTADVDVAIAGGAESMTRAPFVMARATEAFPRSAPTLFDTSLGWRLSNPRMAERFPLESMGETAENLVAKWKISREEQDAFAVESHQKAVAAQAKRNQEIVPIQVQGEGKQEGKLIADDECPRADANLDALRKLRPLFRKDGTVTAGNSSPLNDGASMVVVGSKDGLDRAGLVPLVRVRAIATAGVDPRLMGEGPIPATTKALARAKLSMRDIELIELNEAFAVQAIVCARELGIPSDRLNVRGGAIALGHPIGSSGCRVLVTLLHAMQARGVSLGLATLCVGVGQGIAMIVERV
jgi:acetyl-CoA acyltransferase